MFKKNDKHQPDSDPQSIQTIVGPGVEVKGNFEGEGDIIIEGKLIGALKTKNNLRIGPGAIVEAKIEGANIYIAGKVKGSIKANNELELSESACVDGDILVNSLIIERGAKFNGRSEMNQENNLPKKKKNIDNEKQGEKNQLFSEDELQKIEISKEE